MQQRHTATSIIFALLAVASLHAEPPPERVDLFGDPLPAGALARFGTQRLRHGDRIDSVTFNADGSVANDTVIGTGCTSDVLTGTDGFVYFADYLSGTIYRIARGAGR